MRNKKTGFTLAELLIVVAVIAVLVAISIPIFTSQLEKSRKAACMANCRALKAELSAEYMNHEEMDTSGSVEPDAASSEKYAQYQCRQGGTIKYSLKEGQFEVYCTKHSPNGLTNENMASLKDIFMTGKNEKGEVYKGHEIDSGARNSNFTDDFVDALKKAGVDFEAMGVKSWSVNQEGNIIQWTTSDISTLKKGDTVVIMRCRLDYGGNDYTYTVWKSTVAEKTANGVTYNVLSTDGTQLTKDKDNKQDIDAIKEIYNANKNDDSPDLN